MRLEAGSWGAQETGGMLLGYRAGRQIVVQAVVGPGPKARHSRGSFSPDGAWQETEFTLVYEQSGRMTTYLGDWHSHPGGGLAPSRRDLRTARRVAATPEARTREPLTMILAPVANQWRAGGWVLDRGLFVRARLYPLTDARSSSHRTERNS
jgi:integrative and conjugative element protein (TIGR02256 family)